MDKKNYVIWGSSGHAKVLADIIYDNNGTVVALFDNNREAVSVIKKVPIFYGNEGFEKWISGVNISDTYCGLVAIGGNRGTTRKNINEMFLQRGLLLENLIHLSASVSKSAKVGDGVQILAQSIVAADVVIGDGCILNHKSSVDHECIVGDGVHLAPGATLCGCVELGSNVMIGANAVVLPRLKIGKNTTIGAGAVVTKNIPDNSIAKGNPAVF